MVTWKQIGSGHLADFKSFRLKLMAVPGHESTWRPAVISFHDVEPATTHGEPCATLEDAQRAAADLGLRVLDARIAVLLAGRAELSEAAGVRHLSARRLADALEEHERVTA